MKVENLYMPGRCIRTFTGIYIKVFEPMPEMICIEDIAHALSNQCRFGGHLPEFFSVAQHSLLVCDATSKQNKLAALLHDASEAYLMDIPRPIKKSLSNYAEIEDNLMKAIAQKFGFAYPLPEEVKQIDNRILEIEWEALMLKNPGFHPLKTVERGQAKRRFLETYYELIKYK